MKLKGIVFCEESQAVTKAFRALGHEVYSNDIKPCSGGHPEWHIQGDCFEVAKMEQWDFAIGHPPCTYLTNTGLRWLYSDKTKTSPHPKYPTRKKDQLDAVEFFKAMYNMDIPHIALENPIGVLSSMFMKPTQIIHPYQFGHDASKSTCLWLKNLPLLKPTKIVDVTYVETSTGKRFDKWYWDTSKFRGAERQAERSKTFQGIADAMASQWSEYIIKCKQTGFKPLKQATLFDYQK